MAKHNNELYNKTQNCTFNTLTAIRSKMKSHQTLSSPPRFLKGLLRCSFDDLNKY